MRAAVSAPVFIVGRANLACIYIVFRKNSVVVIVVSKRVEHDIPVIVHAPAWLQARLDRGVAKQMRCFFEAGKLTIVNVGGGAASITPQQGRLTKVLGPFGSNLVFLAAARALRGSLLGLIVCSSESYRGRCRLGKKLLQVLLLHLDNLRITTELCLKDFK
jgi:hypothetical protein